MWNLSKITLAVLPNPLRSHHIRINDFVCVWGGGIPQGREIKKTNTAIQTKRGRGRQRKQEKPLKHQL